MLTFGWWSATSNEILLSHYDYNFNAINETERFANVSGENLERSKLLETSMMGIGWPLKAIIAYTIYSPYIGIVYLVTYLIHKQKTLQARRNTFDQNS